MDIGSIIALIGAAAALGTVFIDRSKIRIERQKLETEKEKFNKDHETSIAEVATKMLAPMSARIDELEKDVKQERSQRETLEKKLTIEKKARCKLQERVEILVGGIKVLTLQLRENGITPAFELPEED